MYEAPYADELAEDVEPWPPSHPEDREWWLSRADAIIPELAKAWEEGFDLATRNSPTYPHPLRYLNPYMLDSPNDNDQKEVPNDY